MVEHVPGIGHSSEVNGPREGQAPEAPPPRSSLVCSVCGREIRPEEQVFWVMDEVHCFQCNDMLEFEYDKERKVDKEMRETGTRWVDKEE